VNCFQSLYPNGVPQLYETTCKEPFSDDSVCSTPSGSEVFGRSFNPGWRCADPCMLNVSQIDGEIPLAVGKAAKRSGVGFPTDAGDRSMALRRSRRRSPAGSSPVLEPNPNSRRSRDRSCHASSYLQGRDFSMKDISTFVGIDIAKKSLDVATLPATTPRTFSHDTKGRRELLDNLPQPETCLVVVEATGGYERLLVADLLDAGHLVAVVNPRQVRNFAKALGILAKTDRIDAAVIARFGQQVKPRPLAEVHEKQGELDQLVTRRRQLVVLRTAEKNRFTMAHSKPVKRYGWVARPEQRDGRGERGEDTEHQTRFNIFDTLRPRPSSTQGVPSKPTTSRRFGFGYGSLQSDLYICGTPLGYIDGNQFTFPRVARRKASLTLGY